MSSHPILVADADPLVRDAIASLLEGNGYAVVRAANVSDALRCVRTTTLDAVVLDLGLSDGGGLSVLRQIRHTSFVPVIMVGAHTEIEERVLALEMGADDYLAKPFAPRELLARMRALLRRTQPTSPVTFGGPARRAVDLDGLHIDVPAREVTVRGDVVEFTNKEFDLLTFLALSPRHVFSRDDLLREVWGSKTDWQDPATVTEHVRRVRRKIEIDPANPQLITTVRSAGYRFESLAMTASAA